MIDRPQAPGHAPRRRLPSAAALLAAGALAASAMPAAAGFAELEDEVHEFRLDNGLTFLVVERPTAPAFAFATYVNAGGADEVPGITGVAHMFEHMAFKGTQTIGTTDYEAESEWLAKIDERFDAWLDERRKGHDADEEALARLRGELDDAIAKAQEFVETNEFTKIVEQHGAVGVNAQTGLDWTRYMYSLPSNRLELWAMIEGDRLSNPVMREFNVERNVVIEERRMRSESSPIGRLFTQFIGLAFPAHPYGDGIIGHRSDLETFTRADAQAFFETYYVGANMTVVVVGDVKKKDVEKLARKYFAGVGTGPVPPPVDTVEPEQTAERRLILEDPGQPTMFIGYPVPSNRHPDYPAYELLGSILGQGRSSRLYTRLVKEDALAAQVSSQAGFPGEKYANLFFVFAIASAGQDPYALEAAIEEILEQDLLENPITQAELDAARARVEADVIRAVRSNEGLSQTLGMFATVAGDWRELFRFREIYDAVTVEDVNRIARETFKRSRRNVGIMAPSEES